MSTKKGKRGLVDLGGERSTIRKGSPLEGQRRQPQKKYFVNRISHKFKEFYYKRKLNGENCNFKIDTGSDISIINKGILKEKGEEILEEKLILKYPSGEEVPVKFRVKVEVQLGKYSETISMFVMEMKDDCLLGADFLKKIKLENIFDDAFRSLEPEQEKILTCSCIKRQSKEISKDLSELYEESSGNLDEVQRNVFVNFLNEYKNIFSENVVAGNCGIVSHKINVKDSSPIKQVPRRIPIQMREEVNKILDEMKEQGAIEPSCSPWVSPAVMVKKKMEQ